MPSLRPTERRGLRAGFAAAARSRAGAAIFATALWLVPTAVHAQGALLHGLFDVEFWATDSASRLLARNAGKAGALGRLQMWTAVEPWRGLVFFAQAEVEGGPVRADEEQLEFYLDQWGVRAARSRALVVEAGKMVHPVGAFGSRRFSNRNPLIGIPDAYPVQYPLGLAVSGATRHFDYRLAAVSLPVGNERYLPLASAQLRPAVGFGVTPTAGVRVGGSATWGPYLNDSLGPALLAGRTWSVYRQRVVAMDAQLSRGYLETHLELARSSYDVPGGSEAVTAMAYYVEAKYTLSPRVYVAARFERNDYPFMQTVGDTAWRIRSTNLYDGEAGIGYRLSASRVLKLTYRADEWRVPPASRAFLPDGHAFAMQVSQAIDFAKLMP